MSAFGPADPLAFSVFFAAGFAAHHLADYPLQSDHQATTKGAPGAEGRWACTRHVQTHVVVQAALTAGMAVATGTGAALVPMVLGLWVNGGSHWWADRRETLRGLVVATDGILDKSRFYANGGAAQIDQAWHIGWLLPSALIMASPLGTALVLAAACAAVLGVAHLVSARALRTEAART